jgi:glucan phosphoethanolaminetransferase (alkaline phosphatase superfamily)
MRLVLTIFWIILGFLILGIFSLNIDQIVHINLFFIEYEQVNLLTVIFLCLFIGFVFGIVFFLIQMAKAKKEKFQLKKQISFLQDELKKISNNETIDAINNHPKIDEKSRANDLNEEDS